MILISDITKRKIAEEKLCRAHDDPGLKIKRRPDRLAKGQEALQAENDSCKQADMVLDSSEAIRRWIADRRNEGIWILDDRNNTIFTNQKMAEMLGYTIEEMAEMPDRLFLSQEWRGKIEDRMLRCRQGIRERIDCKLLRKDGTDLWVSVSCTPIFNDNGSYDGAIGVLSEIAGHGQLEDVHSHEIACLKDLRLAKQAAGGIAGERRSPLTAVEERFRLLKKKSKVLRCGTTLSLIAPIVLLATASFHTGLYGDMTGFPRQSPSNLSVSLSTAAPSPLVSAHAKSAPASPVSAPPSASKISLGSSQQQRLQIPSTYNNKVAVLMYHDVNPNSHQDINVTPDRLDADLTLLQQQGFHIISIAQMAAFMEHRAAVPEKAVAITFDDGYQGVYQYAFPVLKKHNAPATAFIIGYNVGRVAGYLTWPEVRQLDESGLVIIGGHTYNQHQPEQTAKANFVKPATVVRIIDPQTGREETDQEYETRMLADSQLFQDTLKNELGHTTPYFAYPYGAYNATVLKILRDTGFKYMFTVLQGVNGQHEDTTRLYRINVGATWISTKNIPSLILKTVFSPPSGKQPAAWLPEWKS